MVSTHPLLRKFAFVTLSAQAEGLPDCTVVERSDTTGSQSQMCNDPGRGRTILASLQDARIPRLLTRGLRCAATPGYSLPTLRVGRSERTRLVSGAPPMACYCKKKPHRRVH